MQPEFVSDLIKILLGVNVREAISIDAKSVLNSISQLLRKADIMKLPYHMVQEITTMRF